MKTLLITGATGFVGSNMLVREAKLGTRILVSVRDIQKLKRLIASEALPEENITPLGLEPSRWGNISPTHALLAAGVLFARNREDYESVNVGWTLKVLAALPFECRTTVISSQAAGGPTPADIPARREIDADAPITLYGKSKLELERRIQKFHSNRRVTILRPPMILGARDSATIPLFKMANSLFRPKPGIRKKEYSFIAVEDVIEAVQASWRTETTGSFYISSEQTITDFELIQTAAAVANSTGFTLPLPQVLVKCVSRIVDAVPTLRSAVPSLTRDRARDIWADRWVVDSTLFRRQTNWASKQSLRQSLQSAYDFNVSAGVLKPPRQPTS